MWLSLKLLINNGNVRLTETITFALSSFFESTQWGSVSMKLTWIAHKLEVYTTLKYTKINR